MASSQDQEEAQYYQQQLQGYRWRLRVSSKNVEFLEAAVQNLEKSVGSMLKRTEQKRSDGTLQAFMTALSPVATTPPDAMPYYVPTFEDFETNTTDLVIADSANSRHFFEFSTEI